MKHLSILLLIVFVFANCEPEKCEMRRARRAVTYTKLYNVKYPVSRIEFEDEKTVVEYHWDYSYSRGEYCWHIGPNTKRAKLIMIYLRDGKEIPVEFNPESKDKFNLKDSVLYSYELRSVGGIPRDTICVKTLNGIGI